MVNAKELFRNATRANEKAHSQLAQYIRGLENEITIASKGGLYSLDISVSDIDSKVIGDNISVDVILKMFKSIYPDLSIGIKGDITNLPKSVVLSWDLFRKEVK